MDLDQAWRIALPVEALALDPSAPVPSVEPGDQWEVVQALKRGDRIDQSLAAWMELRPAGAVAEQMGDAAYMTALLVALGLPAPSTKAAELMVALEKRVSASLKHCAAGELLSVLPSYADVRGAGHADWGPGAGVLSTPRPVDDLMVDVAGSPKPADKGASPPPWGPGILEWLYHRSSFSLKGRSFRETLHHAYLLNEEPAKVEFRAIDAMRDAYRDLTERARTAADLYALESYESMQKVDDAVKARRSEQEKETSTGPWSEKRENVPAPQWTRWGPLLAAWSDGRFRAPPQTGAGAWPSSPCPGAPAHAATASAMSWLLVRRVFGPSARETDPALAFDVARGDLLCIVQAIGDVRINTGKATVRQFVDWAAEATTISHFTILALALEAARTPGRAVARFAGMMSARRLAKGIDEIDARDASTMIAGLLKKLDSGDGTFESLQSMHA